MLFLWSHHLFQSCVGLVPSVDDLLNQVCVEDRDDWLRQLNTWMSSQVAACIANPAYSTDRSTRAGQAFFLYGSYSPTPSVIMARMLDDASMPLPVPEDISMKLKKWGVRRVVCGHTPHGNAPTVFTSHGVEVRSAFEAAASRLLHFHAFSYCSTDIVALADCHGGHVFLRHVVKGQADRQPRCCGV
jgi:hypothetical protein